MLTKTLMTIDKSINSPSPIAQILRAKRGYYIYFNEPNKKSKKLLIHKHTCGQCAWGSGKIKVKEPGKNGVWLGPFSRQSQASAFVTTYFPAYQEKLHKCVQ